MALWLFLDNKAQVTRDVVTNSDWIEKKTKKEIYCNIDCHIRAITWNTRDTTLSVNTTTNKRKCIVKPDTTCIKQWDYLSVSDPSLWEIGTYQVIDQPKANRLINGRVDSIQFTMNMI
jgi:hypothetical protein